MGHCKGGDGLEELHPALDDQKQPENEEEARRMVAEAPVSDAELEDAALAADINAPDAHSPEEEAALDSGVDDITFDMPDDEEE